MTYISAIGTYVPRLRLARSGIAAAVGWLTGGTSAAKGARTLAFWDEDSITMGVEAARDCLAQVERHQADHSQADHFQADHRQKIRHLSFVTTTPVFREPQQAGFIHAALRLDGSCQTQDLGGVARAGLSAVLHALQHQAPALVVAADMPVAPSGSAAESRLGDGAAAVLVGCGTPLFGFLGGASLTAPFMDHYQGAGEGASLEWEERWQREEGWLKLMPQAMAAALQQAGLTPAEIDCVVMPCTISGCAAQVVKAAGLGQARLAATLAEECGDTGSGHALLMLAHALPSVTAGEKILVAQFGQGATVLVLEAQEAVAKAKPGLATQLAQGVEETNYLKLLAFRGQLNWERGLRGRYPVNKALSTAYRYHEALLGFVGGKCRRTGRVQFPPSRLGAGSQGESPLLDTLDPYPLADLAGRVATSTADRLAFSRSPPNCYGLVDFEGGGRLMMDFTDPDAETLVSPEPVRFVFRIKDMDERTGFRRYFWKAVSAIPQSTRDGS